MATNVFLFGFFLLSFLCGFCHNHAAIPAPTFTVNLDLPPEERWTHVITPYKSKLGIIRQLLMKYIPADLMPLVDYVAERFEIFLLETFSREIIGIAKASGMHKGDIFLLNCLYELTAFCTSIVAQDSSGHILHGRNLDYGNNPLEVEAFKNGTIQVDFQRNGKTVYTATTILGFTGIVNGQKPGVFTTSLDERNEGNAVENFFMAFLDGGTPAMMFMRQMLDDAKSFKDAVSRLSTERLIAPCYYIIGGMKPGEGAVITRDRLKARDVWYLDPNNKRWFLVETNFDHWVPTPKTDDRRYQANKAMNAMGQNKLNNNTLYMALSTQDVFNDRTIVTSVMSAANSSMYSSWIRYDYKDLDTTLRFHPLSRQLDRKLHRF